MHIGIQMDHTDSAPIYISQPVPPEILLVHLISDESVTLKLQTYALIQLIRAVVLWGPDL